MAVLYENWIAELKLLEGNKEMSDTLTGAEMDSMISKVAESMGKTYTAVDAPATRAGFAQRLASLIKWLKNRRTNNADSDGFNVATAAPLRKVQMKVKPCDK